MEPKRNKHKLIQDSLKRDLELLAKRTLTDAEAFESYFNLSGFIKVLNQMKKEAVANGTI